MTQINGLGKGTVNWSDIMSKLKDVDGVGKSAGSGRKIENLTMNEGAAPTEPQLNSTTPEIEVPQPSDTNSDTFASIVNKLNGDKSFDLPDKDVKNLAGNVKNLLGDALKETDAAKDTAATPAAPKSNSAELFFDIYEMFVLLVNCAQVQKNSQRDLRKAETELMMTSIQNQAEMQKSAALTGLIAGSLICGMQAIAAGAAAYKTVSNIKQASALNTEFGVKDAATELSTAQSELKTNVQALEDFEVEHPAPAADAQPDPQIEQQRTELKAKITESKVKVEQKRANMRTAKDVMAQDAKSVKLEISQARTRAISDINMALGNLGQNMVKGFADMKLAEATGKAADQKRAEEELSETKELMQSFQDVIDKVAQLAQAILQVESQSMHDAIQA